MSEREPEPSDERRREKEREKSRKSVWIIDDNSEIAESILGYFKSKKDLGIDFTYYQEGEKAIADFAKYLKIKGQLPDLILMDFKLDEEVENPKYRTGTEVIVELRKMCKKSLVKPPEIIAFSSEKSYREELLGVGATSSLAKNDLRRLSRKIDNLAVQE